MHGTMADLPRITVGLKDADIVGNDNRALQSAVDYMASLGAAQWRLVPVNSACAIRCICVRGGAEGPGNEHGAPQRNAADSALALDGDYGENKSRWRIGWIPGGRRRRDLGQECERISYDRGPNYRPQRQHLLIDRPLNSDCMSVLGARAATVVFPSSVDPIWRVCGGKTDGGGKPGRKHPPSTDAGRHLPVPVSRGLRPRSLRGAAL